MRIGVIDAEGSEDDEDHVDTPKKPRSEANNEEEIESGEKLKICFPKRKPIAWAGKYERRATRRMKKCWDNWEYRIREEIDEVRKARKARKGRDRMDDE